MEDKIQRAIEEGKFDDLPGKGKPLNLEDFPHADPEWRVAFHLLKNNGFTLPWIEARQEIERELAAARQTAARARQQAPEERRQATEAFQARLQALNRRIRDHNLEAPPQFQLLAIDIARELASASI